MEKGCGLWRWVKKFAESQYKCTTCEIFEKVKCSIKLYLKVPVLYNKGR